MSFLLALVTAAVFATPAFADRDVVVWALYDANPLQETADKKMDSAQEWNLRQLLQTRGATFDTVVLPLLSLTELAPSLRRLKPGLRVRGLVLGGHGNERLFAFSRNETYNGTELATLVMNALRDVPVAPELVLHLTGCLNARRRWFRRNLESEFVAQLGRERPPGRFEQLHVVTHRDVSTPQSYKPVGTVGKIAYATGVPSLLSRARSTVSALPNGVSGPVAVMIFVLATALPPTLLPKLGAPDELAQLSILSGFLLGAALAYSERVVSNAVRRTTLGDGVTTSANGTAVDLLPAVYGCPEALGGEHRFGLMHWEAFERE